jgi:ribosomal protein S18 acetylase RimI-like enzyme
MVDADTPFSPIVRQAGRADRQAVTRTVSAAFAHDPAWLFLLGARYDQLAPRFAGALFDLRVGSGGVWVAADLAAVAMWERPGGEPQSSGDPELVWKAYRAVAGSEVWERLMAYDQAVDEARPSTPYWYLGVLATHPQRQGAGLATAVMRPVLEHADAEGIDCCLETSTDRNREFYRRRGFTEATPLHIASGPPTWWLRRAPRGR